MTAFNISTSDTVILGSCDTMFSIWKDANTLEPAFHGIKVKHFPNLGAVVGGMGSQKVNVEAWDIFDKLNDGLSEKVQSFDDFLRHRDIFTFSLWKRYQELESNHGRPVKACVNVFGYSEFLERMIGVRFEHPEFEGVELEQPMHFMSPVPAEELRDGLGEMDLVDLHCNLIVAQKKADDLINDATKVGVGGQWYFWYLTREKFWISAPNDFPISNDEPEVKA